MSSRSKIKGSQAERDLVKYLQEWFPYAGRRLAGATLDKGDISGINGVCIEVKNHAKLDLAGWLSELEVDLLSTHRVEIPKSERATRTSSIIS